MELKNTIRVERAKMRISQRQLAKELNLAKQTINNAESGKDIKLSTAYKIANYFNISITELFTLEN